MNECRVIFTLSCEEKKALQVKLARHGIRQCDLFRTFVSAFLSGRSFGLICGSDQWDVSVRRRKW
jgi:hypothetical protein